MKEKNLLLVTMFKSVGTVISTINSSNSINQYSNDLQAYIINSCGEWNDYLDQFEKNSVKVINLTFNYYNYLPKRVF